MVWTKEERKIYNRKWRAEHPHYQRDYYRNRYIRRQYSVKVVSLSILGEANYSFPVKPLDIVKEEKVQLPR